MFQVHRPRHYLLLDLAEAGLGLENIYSDYFGWLLRAAFDLLFDVLRGEGLFVMEDFMDGLEIGLFVKCQINVRWASGSRSINLGQYVNRRSRALPAFY